MFTIYKIDTIIQNIFSEFYLQILLEASTYMIFLENKFLTRKCKYILLVVVQGRNAQPEAIKCIY